MSKVRVLFAILFLFIGTIASQAQELAEKEVAIITSDNYEHVYVYLTSDDEDGNGYPDAPPAYLEYRCIKVSEETSIDTRFGYIMVWYPLNSPWYWYWLDDPGIYYTTHSYIVSCTDDIKDMLVSTDGTPLQEASLNELPKFFHR